MYWTSKGVSSCTARPSSYTRAHVGTSGSPLLIRCMPNQKHPSTCARNMTFRTMKMIRVKRRFMSVAFSSTSTYSSILSSRSSRSSRNSRSMRSSPSAPAWPAAPCQAMSISSTGTEPGKSSQSHDSAYRFAMRRRESTHLPLIGSKKTVLKFATMSSTKMIEMMISKPSQ